MSPYSSSQCRTTTHADSVSGIMKLRWNLMSYKILDLWQVLSYFHLYLTWTSKVMGPLLSTSKISPFLVPTRMWPWPRDMARMEGLSSKSNPAESMNEVRPSTSCPPVFQVSKFSHMSLDNTAFFPVSVDLRLIPLLVQFVFKHVFLPHSLLVCLFPSMSFLCTYAYSPILACSLCSLFVPYLSVPAYLLPVFCHLPFCYLDSGLWLSVPVCVLYLGPFLHKCDRARTQEGNVIFF